MPKPAAPKHNADMPPHERPGIQLTNQIGSMKKPIAKRFSLGLPELRSRPYQRRSVSQNRTPQIFVQASAARIHDIGIRWLNSSEFRRITNGFRNSVARAADS